MTTFKTFYNKSLTIYFTNENIDPLKEGPWWKASVIRKIPEEAKFVQVHWSEVFGIKGSFDREIPCSVTVVGAYEFEFLDKNKFPLKT